MKHLGDITKIDGHAAMVVDCIIGGSPCQDLSIAGKRSGLQGERSGLFMEQIRLIKEMRKRDKSGGRTNDAVRPRFCVWENVPGAFSSNGGKDFQAVLTEFIRIAEPDAPDVPLPAKGKWPLADAYYGDGWSVAYRVHDAQFWGVPQRRRRIALVADFGGHAAPEVLFERQGLRGDFAESGKTTEEAAGDVGRDVNPAVEHTLTEKENPAEFSAGKGTGEGDFGCTCIPINDKATRYRGGGNTRNGDGAGNGLGVGRDGDPSPTLTAGDRHAVCLSPVVAGTLCGSGAGTSRPSGQKNEVDCWNYRATATCGTLQDKDERPIMCEWIARRLTPLECERLQGYPDGWTGIDSWVDSKGKLHKESSDSARYKALGNSIALPFWKWLLKRISSQYERDATMASLFDGIGGFPFLWEQINGKGSCLWVSEIEEFPMAVTKYHFGE